LVATTTSDIVIVPAQEAFTWMRGVSGNQFIGGSRLSDLR